MSWAMAIGATISIGGGIIKGIKAKNAEGVAAGKAKKAAAANAEPSKYHGSNARLSRIFGCGGFSSDSS